MEKGKDLHHDHLLFEYIFWVIYHLETYEYVIKDEGTFYFSYFPISGLALVSRFGGE